jgi:hypothetical protein
MASTQVNPYEARTHLSSLVERAAQGEEIVIAKAGKPVARLLPLIVCCFGPGSGCGAAALGAKSAGAGQTS